MGVAHANQIRPRIGYQEEYEKKNFLLIILMIRAKLKDL